MREEGREGGREGGSEGVREGGRGRAGERWPYLPWGPIHWRWVGPH